MSTDTVVRARIDGETKARATEALKAMGLSVSDVIRMVLLRVAEEKRLPFVVQVPNATTLEAMKELDDGKGQRFDTAEELFRDLGNNRIARRSIVDLQCTAVFRKVPKGYIAFVEEFPGANIQGASLEEARANLREAVALVIEANREMAHEDAAGGAVIREPITVTA